MRLRNWIPPLFVQIYLLFVLSLGIGGIVTYLANLNTLKKNEEAILKQTTFFAQQSLMELMRGDIARVERLINAFEFKPIKALPSNAQILTQSKNTFGLMQVFKVQQNYGFHLEYLGMELIAFRDFSVELADNGGLNVWIFLDFLVLLLTFSMILALLHPLKVLQSGLEEFSQGNYQTHIPVPKEPQQAKLARSFNTMCKKISKLMLAREFVLRNIAHELKTPISKAKLALELMPENPQKGLVSKCIHHLDNLSSQILTFEKIQEGKDLLHLEDFDVETLFLRTLEQLFIEEEDLEIMLEENFKIRGDLQFLSIALRNLIENAFKYKSGGKVILRAYVENGEQRIAVKNNGEALQQEIAYYLEPFSRDKEHALISGYGLGLGIVKGVLELHHFKLEYFYKQGVHCFVMKLESKV
ncbi:ATP-binding protein [Helicobacter winghamensis]|uniref:histidine kinase n=1 Tax=Helicobacter winghamensis TaxID=157268 RepID=A0A2N3PJ20_9HELI|nr:ATP-binding protein [Helicobacter winghamensis]PKT78353.1 two-component sensor histidine kinase [Helicobacter winghamensis]PKT81037.1 two-component sensor histidine kinase [Helicobacter winghamensis]PKT82262.1 two-component sensor histidine kinase [Helicobacter winghamensis]